MSYDFIIKSSAIKYIIESKSRLGNVGNHTFEIMSFNKINKYRKNCNKDANVKCIFIFNHIDTDDNMSNDYQYYEIQFERLYDVCDCVTVRLYIR